MIFQIVLFIVPPIIMDGGALSRVMMFPVEGRSPNIWDRYEVEQTSWDIVEHRNGPLPSYTSMYCP